jgi:hypothetical protein
MALAIYAPQQNTQQNPLQCSGYLTFDCGTRIYCNICKITTSAQPQNLYWQNVPRGIRNIEIEIVCSSSPQNDIFWNQKLIHTGYATNYKTNPIYENGQTIKFGGFWVKEITYDINGTITIDATCDYYDFNPITPQEEVRIIREKKLKRILNG